MAQVTEFVPAGAGARATLVALGKVAREIPAGGEPFRELRSRLRAAKLWDRERPAAVLRVLGVGGATISSSPFVTKLRWFRDALKDKGIRPCIPGPKSRGKAVRYDKRRYRRRNRIEIMFGPK